MKNFYRIIAIIIAVELAAIIGIMVAQPLNAPEDAASAEVAIEYPEGIAPEDVEAANAEVRNDEMSRFDYDRCCICGSVIEDGNLSKKYAAETTCKTCEHLLDKEKQA